MRVYPSQCAFIARVLETIASEQRIDRVDSAVLRGKQNAERRV